MQNNPAKLANFFTEKTSSFIANAGIQSYEYAYDFFKKSGLLLTKRGCELLIHARNVIYDLYVIELSKTGAIPFSYKENLNKSLNCHHAVFFGEKCKFSISQVRNPVQFPRASLFRGLYAANNEISLFDEDEKQLDYSMAYFILTHGGYENKLSFARIGLPLSGQRKWACEQLILFDRNTLVVAKKEDAKKVEQVKPKLKNVTEQLNTLFN